jgi:hypothetical protein
LILKENDNEKVSSMAFSPPHQRNINHGRYTNVVRHAGRPYCTEITTDIRLSLEQITFGKI